MTAQTLPRRAEVPEHLTWDLTSIYKNNELWESDFSKVSETLAKIKSYQGKLSSSAKTLLEALNLIDSSSEILGRLYVYANMRSHEDLGDSVYQALADRVTTLMAEFASASSYTTPEILALSALQLNDWLANTPGLQVYRHQFDELNRRRPHVRNAEVEALLADASEVMESSDRVYSLLTNADFKLPKVPDANGDEIQLSQGNYVARFLESHDRDERKRAFEAMLGTYADYKNTISATYSARVKADMFYAKARNYDNCLHQALESINVPVSVYTTLVETVEKNLPSLHRYLRLRKKLMGLPDLHMYDLYVPMVKEVEYKIAFEHAREKVIEALAPLGKEYVDALKNGMLSRWIDVVETHGKRSGAYSWGTFGTNPFVLLNYQESMDSMFTLAHEMGHSMHSYFTRKSQPFQYADYTLFVAEVASTCNEALLTDYLLKNTDDKALRMYVINHALEGFRTTLFRQTLFAEFEMQAHAAAEAGQALTPEFLCATFKELNQKYYGAEVIIDDAIEIEWARIPHFYSSFYVYQYATGISAATALAKQIVDEGQPAVLRYLGFLSSGSSDYSIELLRKAGVDLSSPQPIQDALDTFSKYVDEFDSLS